MPLTVMLLTPFAHMPVWAMALSWSVLKLLVMIAVVFMVISVTRHNGQRIPYWVVALGLAWTVPFVIGDIQHGNTNIFVLGAIVFHLWLFSRGRDWLAGAPLALAICLKMTPALFVLYWLYQRNWKLLGGTLLALAILAMLVPAAALGPAHYVELTHTWLDNLIIPGLVKGSWYPIHINQSLSGMLSRLCLGGQAGGNIFWNPDDTPYSQQTQEGWIAMWSMTDATTKMVLRVCQLVIVAAMAWAIGGRQLPRHDGRRGLHYALVLLGMMLLNQRTWDHHAAVLVLAGVAIWYAIAFGRFSLPVRATALAMMLAPRVLAWCQAGDTYTFIAAVMGKSRNVGKEWGDWAEAYGPTFFYFLLLFIPAVIMSVAMRKSACPYAEVRQKLSRTRRNL